jgi:hypothetical protein
MVGKENLLSPISDRPTVLLSSGRRYRDLAVIANADPDKAHLAVYKEIIELVANVFLRILSKF